MALMRARINNCFFLKEKRGKKGFALVQIRTAVGARDKE
jgi:hypothetical protein